MEPNLPIEALIRGATTLFLFMSLALLEAWLPRRARNQTRITRWPANLAIQVINGLLVRWLLPWALPVLIAVQASEAGFGLMNWLTAPAWVAVAISLLLLDLLIYWQHRLTHLVPFLWRLHRMHHTDVDIDVSSALRFHPLEILLSTLLKACAVWLLGVPVEAVLLFAVILNGMAMFNHANLKLPQALDKLLRKLVVTPDMHRVHHSVIGSEHNSNFGFNLSIWDRLFGSYCAQPELGHNQMILGLNETNGQKTGSLLWMLKQPLQ